MSEKSFADRASDCIEELGKIIRDANDERTVLSGDRDACRSALEQVLSSVNRYRSAHSVIESGKYSDSDLTEQHDAYVNLLVVSDDMARFTRPTIPCAPSI